ncbi:hypothetical protein JZ751_002733, partial [Albula glossodonta]
MMGFVHAVNNVEVTEDPFFKIGVLLFVEELDDCFVDNEKVILQSIAEDLRACLPVEAMLPSESLAIDKTQQKLKPTVHVDAFLYDEDAVDSLCDESKLSRYYCLHCGSQRTAPLGFISHSFSVLELRFLFQNVLPDLSGKVLVDVGSRLGAVLYGGCLYSSAAQLVGVEISAEFTELQKMIVEKYGFSDRVQIVHSDICAQASLLQNADVVVMNNVFEYFLESNDQIRAWHWISQNVRKKGALLVTVPSIQESFATLQLSNILVLFTLFISLHAVSAHLFIILLQGCHVFSGLRELSLLHTLAYIPVHEGTLGIHQVKLVVQTGPGLCNGSGVAQHAHCSLNFSQVSTWNHSRGLVIDTDFETCGAPVHKLDGALGLDSANGSVDVFGHHITA